jgi:beta-glucosidase
MKKKSNLPLWISLSAVFGAFAIVLGIATPIAFGYAPVINAALKVETRVSGDGEDFFKSDYKTAEEKKAAGKQLVEDIEGEGITLLKNDNNALPLAKGSKVTAFGKTSQDIIISGAGSSGMSISDAPTIKEAFTSAGLEVNQTLIDFYATGKGSSYKRSVQDGALNNLIKDNSTSYVREVPLSEYTSAEWGSVSNYGDAAIVMLGRIGGEGGDIPWFNSGDGNGNQLELTQEEKDLFSKIKDLKDKNTVKKIVVVLNMSNPLEMDFVNKAICGVDYGIDAVLWIGETGSYGLNSLGKVLTGDINPSGKLVDTFCYDNLTSPAMQNTYVTEYTNAASQGLSYATSCNNYYAVYQEGIYVGYRYYETRYEDLVLGNAKVGTYDYASSVAYPFGYGLSYSNFSYSNFKFAGEDETNYNFTVDVKNNSSVGGKNTVEVFLQSPYSTYDKENGIEKSAVELAGFAKVEVEGNGEAKDVSISVSKDSLKAYDSKKAKTYIKDEGNYYFSLGNGAHEAINNILAAKSAAGDETNGKVDAAKMIGKGESSLVYKLAVSGGTDTTTFAKSKNSTPVTNQFDHADLNRIDEDKTNDVNYVSRSDWNGTMPQASFTAKTYKASFSLAANDTISEALKATYKKNTDGLTMPTFSKANGLKLIQFRGIALNETITVNGKSYSWDDLLDQMSYAELSRLAATAFHNTVSIKSISKPATHDENGAQGFTTTLTGGGSGTAYPSEDLRAATFNKDLYEKTGILMGNDALLGKTLYSGLYGTNANIHRTPYGGRNFEYYSEDPYVSGKALTGETHGLKTKGVYAYMKHFVLNDQETGRDGLSVWANEQTIREIYLKPFQMAVENDGGQCVMTSFNRIGATWAGADKNLLTNVLKSEFGMTGMAITDYSNSNQFMEVRLGLQAGSDLWDCSGDIWTKALLGESNNPEIAQALRKAAQRVLYTVVNSNAMNGLTANSDVVGSTPWWEVTLIGLVSGFGVLTAGSVTMMIVTIVKRKKEQS